VAAQDASWYHHPAEAGSGAEVRNLTLFCFALIFVGCSGDPSDGPGSDDASDGAPPGSGAFDRSACDAYLACVAEVEPSEVAVTLELYGDESACWTSADNAELCADACVDATAELSAANPAEEACLVGERFAPALGHWTPTRVDYVVDECAWAQADDPPTYAFELSADAGNDAGFLFRYDFWSSSLQGIACALTQMTFDCETLSDDQDLSDQGYDAIIHFEGRYTGTFRTATQVDLTYHTDLTCTGSSCALISSIPCSEVIDNPAEADAGSARTARPRVRNSAHVRVRPSR
jgi:hypothetical protein